MKKLLLSFGAIATAMTPIVAVVSCGDEATNAQKALNKIADVYINAENLENIIDDVKALPGDFDLTKISDWETNGLKIETKLASAFTDKETGYEVKMLMAEAGKPKMKDLKVKVIVTEKDGTETLSTAQKILTVKYDKEEPSFTMDTSERIGDKVISYVEGANSGSLDLDKTNDSFKIKLSTITDRISAQDNAFGSNQITMAYAWKDSPIAEGNDTIDLVNSDNGGNLVATATDILGNVGTFTFTITIINSDN